MHTGPSESTILRNMLEKEISEKTHLKEKLEDVLGDLEVECDVSSDRIYTDRYYCGIHGAAFEERRQPSYICPVGKFALQVKKKHE